MSALTKPRRIQNLVSGLMISLDFPVAANVVLYKGAQVALNANGYLVPAAATLGLRVVGVVDTGSGEHIDTTGMNDGDVQAKVQLAIWKFQNSSGGDAITQADVWKRCFAVDDQTVAKTDGGVPRPVAGVIVAVDASGVFVASGVLASLLGVEDAIRAPSNLVTTGALGVTTRTTRLSVTGTQAYSLADGVYVGQRKSLRCTVAAATPAGNVTPAHASGFTTISAFDAVGDFAELEWNGTAWEVVFSSGVTVA
jgi:hypothetical protein